MCCTMHYSLVFKMIPSLIRLCPKWAGLLLTVEMNGVRLEWIDVSGRVCVVTMISPLSGLF